MKNETITVTGMTCVHCRNYIEKLVDSIKGVSSTEVFLDKGQAKVSYDPGKVQLESILEKINQTHYKASID